MLGLSHPNWSTPAPAKIFIMLYLKWAWTQPEVYTVIQSLTICVSFKVGHLKGEVRGGGAINYSGTGGRRKTGHSVPGHPHPLPSSIRLYAQWYGEAAMHYFPPCAWSCMDRAFKFHARSLNKINSKRTFTAAQESASKWNTLTPLDEG